MAEEEHPFNESDRRYLSLKKNLALFLSRYLKSRLSSPVSLVINLGYLLSHSLVHSHTFIKYLLWVGTMLGASVANETKCFLHLGSSVSSMDKLCAKQRMIQTNVALKYG